MEGGRNLGGVPVRHRIGADPRKPGVVFSAKLELIVSAVYHLYGVLLLSGGFAATP